MDGPFKIPTIRRVWAADQRSQPLPSATATVTRWSFPNAGDREGGLSVVDRAIVAAETGAHVLTTEADLGRSRDVVRLAGELTSKETGLWPNEIVDIHTSTARAPLDLGDRDGASLSGPGVPWRFAEG